MSLSSIPFFPTFHKIGLNHQEDIDNFTKKFQPYSDYSFVSLHSWNINENFSVSSLNNKLVVIFEDYHSTDLFLGCIGQDFFDAEIQFLLDKSRELGFGDKLKLIPEIVITNSIKENFIVEEDFANNDYILSVDTLLTYPGNKLRNKKSQLNHFTKSYGNVKCINLEPSSSFDICEDLLKVSHNKESDFFEDEKSIITKCLNSKSLPTNVFAIFVDDKISSFCIYEICGEYLIIHFEKFNTFYQGINSFSKNQLAKVAKFFGCKYINWEQDLGLDQLREAKKQFRPVDYLRKYTITSK